MKFLLFLFVLSCSWNHKDFEKSLKKEVRVAEPEVKVDSSLLEKFEVQDEVPPAPAEKTSSTPTAKKAIQKTVQDKKVKTVTSSKPKVTSPDTEKKVEKKVRKPEDYPKELEVINKKASEVWKLYRPNHKADEKVFLNINYLGMTVGKIMFTNNGKKMMNDKEVWHLHARFKSAPFYSRIYELDDTVDTFVTTDEFLSTRYSLIQRESKQDIDDLQLHDRDQLKTFWFYKRKTKDKTREKEESKYIPYYSLDPFSVVFFYQGLPLKDGDIYEIPLINKTKILILKSVVEGREEIRTSRGRKRAIKVHATTQYSGDHLKSGELYFWFSDDESRTLLKAQAKIKIGSVTAEIVD